MPSSRADNPRQAPTREADEGLAPGRNARPEDTQEPESGAAPPSDHAEQLAAAEARLLRALADLDNYRKRAAREVERRVSDSREGLLRDFLEPLDNIERALQAADDSPLAQGVRGVFEQMETLLARHGVDRIGAVGERFDPQRHEAVAVRESDEWPDGTIVDIARAGFAIGDRVLRPAQVVVAKRPRASS